MDAFGDHALTCPCRGDRTTRHNVLRDGAYSEAHEGRLDPEREKAGLLPTRPFSDGLKQDVSDNQDGNRRLADVWLPRGGGFTNGRPEALDFAVTSGMRADTVRKSAHDASQVLLEYANYKETYKDTKRKCSDENFVFTPIIFEAHGGGWCTSARRIFDFIAKQQSCAGSFCREGTALRLAQRISTSLHRENARATMKRLWQKAYEGPQVHDMSAEDSDEAEEFEAPDGARMS